MSLKTFKPQSCDTFAVLPPGTLEDCIIFGKNSDRPCSEVQEVVYYPAMDYLIPCKLRCTYIDVDQVQHTHAVILSKPSWMWGAEMGSNEHGVCIGNEAVWTNLNDSSDSIEKLLGMDLLRLALERSKTALEALHVIVKLLNEYGMGGNCSDTEPDFTYHNSFLIADPSEVWILECPGKIWAAQQIVQGVRNISNELSIHQKIDLKCDGLEQFAIDNGFWNPKNGPFNFKYAFEGSSESHRYKCGRKLLTNLSSKGQFKETDMFSILRDKSSGICMSGGGFLSTGSQVSVLRKPESGLPSIHWFTATPDPAVSVFKPFIFTANVLFPKEVISPIPDPGTLATQLQYFDRRYDLYKKQELCLRRTSGRDVSGLKRKLKDIESKYIELVKEISENFTNSDKNPGELFKIAVEEEYALYQA